METREDTDFRLSAQRVREAITPRTKALILPYPNNPTGAVMGREELEELAQVVRERELLVISDEIYSELTYGGGACELCIAAGYVALYADHQRFQQVLCHDRLARGIHLRSRRAHQRHEQNPSVWHSLRATAGTGGRTGGAAFRPGENGYEDVRQMRESYNRRRRLMVDGLRKMGLHCFEPRGAFYVFPSIQSTGLSSETFCERLLQEKRVACVPVRPLAPAGRVHRCSYATAVDNYTYIYSNGGLCSRLAPKLKKGGNPCERYLLYC